MRLVKSKQEALAGFRPPDTSKFNYASVGRRRLGNTRNFFETEQLEEQDYTRRSQNKMNPLAARSRTKKGENALDLARNG